MRVIKEESEDGASEMFRDADQQTEEKPVVVQVKEEIKETWEEEEKQQELDNSLNTETSPSRVKTEKSSSGETTEEEAVFICVHCGDVFNHDSFLQSETLTEDHFTCHNCGKDFRGESHTDHLPNHTTAKKHQCPQCHETFDSADDLKTHFKSHSREKLCFCSQCGRAFSDRGLLNVHVRSHNGQKPFSCPQCGKRFTRTDGLKNHMRIHTGEKPYVCPQCGKSFFRSWNLSSHMMSHTFKKTDNGLSKKPTLVMSRHAEDK